MADRTGPPWPQPWPDIDSSLTAIIDGLDQANIEQASEGTLVDLARRLSQLDRIMATLADMASNVETSLIEDMEADEVEVPGIGWLHRTPKESDTWRHQESRDDLRRHVTQKLIARLASDPMTGEVHPPLKRVVEMTVEALYEALSVGNPKAGLRRLELDPEDYRAKQPAGYKLALVHPDGVSS